VHSDYRAIDSVLVALRMYAVDRHLADYSRRLVQMQIRTDPQRALFSFRRDDRWLLRMVQTAGPIGAEAIRSAGEQTSLDVIYQVSARSGSRRGEWPVLIVGVARGRHQTTGQLAGHRDGAALSRGKGLFFSGARPGDPARFQEFRYWVNRELEGLETIHRRGRVQRLAAARAAGGGSIIPLSLRGTGP
jgi:16S rRNA C1402 N4-methylase RsmH